MKQQTGMSLIEVLVSVLVLSFGVLGTIAMQVNALKFNQSSLNRSQATYAATDILDRMRANRTAAKTGSYNLALSSGAPTGQELPSTDLSEWRNYLTTLLPDGKGSVAVVNGVATITIQWDERRADNSNDEALKAFTFTSEL